MTYIPKLPHPCLGQALLIDISNLDWRYRILDPASQFFPMQSSRHLESADLSYHEDQTFLLSGSLLH